MDTSIFCVLVILLISSQISMTSTSSLYQEGDQVVQLNGQNFFETIKNKDTAWLVEFYATWCGHCQRFAPLYKALAQNVKGWNHMVKIASVSCSDARNSAFCRQVNIKGYPTLRFFPPYLTSDGFHGVDYIGGQSMVSLQRSIVDYLSTMNILPPSWPRIEPIRNIQEAFLRPKIGARFVMAIVESLSEDGMNEFTAKKLLFDLSGLPQLQVVRYQSNSKPSGVYITYSDGTMETVAQGRDRVALRNKVLSYLQEDVTQSELFTTTHQPSIHVSTATSGLHMQDLESSLYYTLWFEVGGKQDIYGSSLRALKKYIKTLRQFFPGQPYITNFLTELDNWLQTRRGHLRGEAWVQKLDSLQSAESYVPKQLRWTGCAGSQSWYRGYPCSMWQTFHALTVNALERNRRNSVDSARKVLVNIREYIRHFFGCRDCARHFLAMAQHLEAEIRTPHDGVLWLWRAHNRVNHRLAGDSTEDPHHPKKEFPTVAQCPTCRLSHVEYRQESNNETRWNNEEVMIFLRRFYGSDFVIPDNHQYTFILETTVESTPPPIYIPGVSSAGSRGGEHYQTTDDVETSAGIKETWVPHNTTDPPPVRRRQPSRWAQTPPPPQRRTPEPSLRWSSAPIRPGPALTPAPTLRPWWTPRRQTLPAAGRPSSRILNQDWHTPTTEGTRPEKELVQISLHPTPREVPRKSCPELSTEWTKCSVTCGTGVSTHLTNQNSECKTKLETRICQLRPCNYRFVQRRKQVCGATYRSREFLKLTYGDCETTSRMQWRYCGECYGKCCYPKRSRTQEIGLVCGKQPDTLFGYANVHIIELCECSDHCY